MQTIIRCKKGSCSPGVKNLGDVAMQSGTSVRNAQEKFIIFHVKLLKTVRY